MIAMSEPMPQTPDGFEAAAPSFGIYPKGGGWRVWCLRSNMDAEPHQPVDYATKTIARIVAESLQHACTM